MPETREPGPEDADRPAGALSLADLLADLRAELAVEQDRVGRSALKLRVEEVTVSPEVAVTTGRTGKGSGRVSAKFWVLNAEAGGSGELSPQRMRTQQLTLTLKPRVEQVTYDTDGRVEQVTLRGLDVTGAVEAGEEAPLLQGAADQQGSTPRGSGG
jgi:hypothetical protein